MAAQSAFNYQQLFVAPTVQITCTLCYPVGHYVDPTVYIFEKKRKLINSTRNWVPTRCCTV